MNNIINENLINLDVKGTTKEEVVFELAELIDQEGRLADYGKYCTNVMEREKLSTTGIGFGIAIPHGKCISVKEPTVAYGKKMEGLEWESLDGAPAQMIFLIAVPDESESNVHLKILAALSRKLMDEDFRAELLKADDAKTVLTLLDQTFQKALES